MLWNDFGRALRRAYANRQAGLIVCAFIALVMAGSLTLTSCSSTEAGLARETQLYLVASNNVHNLKQLVPYVPPPVNGLLEGVLAVGGALLALWATHLHRSLNEIRNGKPGSAAAPGAAAGAPERPPGA